MSYHTATKFIEKLGYTMEGTSPDTIRNNHTPEDAEEIIELMMNEPPRTITVNGYFGDKQMTIEEFTREWTEHTKQLWRIMPSSTWMERVSEFSVEVELACHSEFVRMWQEQTGEEWTDEEDDITSRCEPHITF